MWHYFSTILWIPVLLLQGAPGTGLEGNYKKLEEVNLNIDIARVACQRLALRDGFLETVQYKVCTNSGSHPRVQYKYAHD